MKKYIFSVFLIALCLLTLTACDNEYHHISENFPESSGEISNEISDIFYFTFDGYGEAGGMLNVTELFEGSTQVTESVSWTFDAKENETIKNALSKNGIVAIEPTIDPTYEADTFEGWMIFKETISTDEEGFDTYSYERISGEKLFTISELFELPMPNYNLTFAAKWSSVPIENYFVDSFSNKPIADTCHFSLYANGGIMNFSDVETDNFQLERYNYWLNEGYSLETTMTGDIINSAILKSIEKKDATFTGWTIYEADFINWSSEEILEEGTKNFLYDSEDEDFKYMYLENCVLYKENASTEEMKKIEYNGKHYYAIANWE